MKPRIFIAIHYLELGGAETSLIGLLHAFDPEKVDVDLFVYSHQGTLMNEIPSYVNLLPENKTWSMFEKPMKEVLKKGYLRMFLARMRAKYLMRRYANSHHPKDDTAIYGYMGQEVAKIVPTISPGIEYDLAISYVNPHDFWLKHIRAKKKICWIHTDYSKIDINVDLELPVWGAYDRIVSISPDCTKSFVAKFPSLKCKILELDNILPQTIIKSKVSLNSKVIARRGDETILVSVGRINHIKNHHNFPFIAKILKEKGLKFQWLLIGPGLWEGLNKSAEEIGVDDVFRCIGPSDNPYPFIKECDIFVHPSRYEGKSIVVREAQILCKPVIITNYPTAKSQINDGVDGVICELDNEKIAEAIFQLANDKNKQNELIVYLQNHDYAGLNEVNKIYKLIDG